MQKIINGYLYDTDAAILLLYNESNGRRYYQTLNNGFFVAYPNGTIQVWTADAMKNFLGQNDIAKYIEVFGEPKEG